MIRVRVKTPFGEITINADDPQETLETLKSFLPSFMEEMSEIISTRFTPTKKALLKGIVEFTKEGPIITTRKGLTHYEAIGLILYASAEKMYTAA